MASPFTRYQKKAYPYLFAGRIKISSIAGGTPTSQKTAEGWIRSKFEEKDDTIRRMVAETLVERGVKPDDASGDAVEEAISTVVENQHLSGFKRNPNGLYIEGRQLKACLKEAASVAANSGKLRAKGWGKPDNENYKKGIKAWFPEHVFVKEDILNLGATEPTGIAQRFIHGRHGSAIQYEEYVENAVIEFTVETDYDFEKSEWAALWLTAEQLGLGASRSQGYGRFKVTEWKQLD